MHLLPNDLSEQRGALSEERPFHFLIHIQKSPFYDY